MIHSARLSILYQIDANHFAGLITESFSHQASLSEVIHYMSIIIYAKPMLKRSSRE